MEYVPVPSVSQVEMRYSLQNIPCENTLYFRAKPPATTVDQLPLAEALKNWWGTFIFPLMVVNAVLREVYVTDLTTQTGEAVSYTEGLPLTGEIALEPMPNNVAACISFRTAQRGRSFRGRNYLMGLSVDQVLGNNLLEGVAEDYVGAYMQLPTVAAAVGCDWVVVSRYSGSTIVDGKRKPTPRAVGVSTPVTAALFVDLTVDTQRGRLR